MRKSLHSRTTLAAVMVSLALGICTSVLADAQDALRANLNKILPQNMPLESIAESPMPGVYEVRAGEQDLYVYSQGQYLMVGDVYDTELRVSLGEQKKQDKMVSALATLPVEEMIIMGDQESARYVTVFTDTDCGYCQKFHTTINDLAKGGLQVRYLMFPRAGLESDSYAEAVSVWCADDQGQAMTIAKSGGAVKAKTCDNPVAAQYQLGQQIGVRGTPTMVLDNGKVIPGYVDAAELLAQAGL